MKVCIVTNSIPPAFSGAGLRAYRFAQRLDKKGILGFILTRTSKDPCDGTGLQKKELADYKIERLHAVRYRQTAATDLLRCFWSEYVKLPFMVFFTLYKNKKNFDIVHCFGASGSMLSLYALAAGKLLGKKTVMGMTLLNQDDPLAIRKNDPFILKRKFKNYVYRGADAFVSISKALTDAYKKSELDLKKLYEIANPVDVTQFFPIDETEKQRLRKQLRIDSDKCLILSVGAIVKRKGIDILVESFFGVARKYPTANLLLIGPTTLEPLFFKQLEDQIEKYGIEDKISFTGQIDNVQDYMKVSDVFIFASKREGMPNVILEAMACGLPIVTTNIPGITDTIITDRRDGLIVEADFLKNMTIQIEGLLADSAMRKTLSENAVKKIRENYLTEMIDQKYYNVYSALEGTK